MEYESFIALVEDGGGFDKIVRLIFDNSIHTSFVRLPEDKRCKKSDFVKLGSEWFYKEPVIVRNCKDYDYTEPMYAYHPLSCLQAVIMGDDTNVDIQGVSSILT